MSNRLDQLQKLLAADPDDAFCLYGIAQEHAKEGDHARAIEYYDRATAADPSYCYAYYHKARSQSAMADIAGARATLELGLQQAQSCGDEHAASEIFQLLDELS